LETQPSMHLVGLDLLINALAAHTITLFTEIF
jgi:hypothetical protein